MVMMMETMVIVAMRMTMMMTVTMAMTMTLTILVLMMMMMMMMMMTAVRSGPRLPETAPFSRSPALPVSCRERERERGRETHQRQEESRVIPRSGDEIESEGGRARAREDGCRRLGPSYS